MLCFSHFSSNLVAKATFATQLGCGLRCPAQKATFVQITNAGMKESHAHDVEVTKEAPNYSRK
jgi:IMP dehydrogenase